MVAERPQMREAQRKLAMEMTGLVHRTETAVTKAEQASKVLFGGDLEGLDADDILEIFSNVPSSQITGKTLSGVRTCPLLIYL